MKTPEEIKKWLKCLAFDCGFDLCGKCEYDELCIYPDAALRYAPNALAYIEQLEKKVEDAEAAIQEKDRIIYLMKEQMRGRCSFCKYRDKYTDAEPCASCMSRKSHSLWEYVGLPELPKKGES